MKLPSLKNVTGTPLKVEIVISSRTVVRVMLVVVATIIALAALGKLSHALILISTAFFLSLALNAPVHWIGEHLPGKRKGSRSVATSISFLMVVIVLSGFIAAVVPPAISQVSNFVETIPKITKDARNENSTIGELVKKYKLDSVVNDSSEELSSALKNSGKGAISTVSSFGAGLVALITVLAMTFMMLVEGPRWIRLGKLLLPEEKRDHAEILSRQMYAVIKGYVNGQVTLAALAAVIMLPVMLILQVPYAAALAVIVFICGLIPMFGHTIGAVIVTLIAVLESPVSALLLLGFYILYQQIENYVVQPRVQASATNMSPLLVFVAVIIGINLNGLLGGLVAIPVAGCLRILVIDYLRTRGMLTTSLDPVPTSDSK